MSNYMVTRDGELYHYGVKGMKWGVRKARQDLDKIGYTAKSGTRYGLTKGDTTAFGKNAVGINRKAAKRHNLEIKKNYDAAKTKVENKELSRFSKEYRLAKGARRRNLVGRAVTQNMGFTDSGRGSYYRHRAAGETRTLSAVKAIGRQTVTNFEYASGPLGIAAAAGEGYLREQGVIR